ncbi:MAG: alkaline phosphatase family protein [Myxococcota bacterium]|nr:alkaline phosphatase family protein [Myxococcota bacterium]
MQWTKWAVLPALLAASTLSVSRKTADAAPAVAAVSKYDHIFLIIEENHGFSQIIGNAKAPHLNALAKKYGLATKFFTEASPSAGNYVAMVGGDFFGISDDNPYYTHTLNKPSLMSQLDGAHLSWKGYFQGMPYPGFRGACFPDRCDGVPDYSALYAAKHNGIPYFKSVQDSATDFAKMVPIQELSGDLMATVPNFSYIVPDQCHNMHGAPPFCVDAATPGGVNDSFLVGAADAYAGQLVDEITSAPFWTVGNNAVVITWDEGADGDLSGCCDANPGTGQVATIVITSHGPRGVKDATPYNHYSLLQTFEKAFGLGCIANTCDTAHVTPMAPLFKAP